MSWVAAGGPPTTRRRASRRARTCRSIIQNGPERVGSVPPDAGRSSTAFGGHVCGGPADYPSMSADRTPPPILAYETQARYGPGEAWITLDVSVSHALAVDEA